MVETPQVESQETFTYMIAIKFKGSKKAYHFGTNSNEFKYGDPVVVETVRGIELGEAISDLRDCKEHTLNFPLKPILRKATARDIEDFKRNKEDEPVALAKCQECVNRLQLDMNLISAEYTLDRNKVIFSYVSDERVDFRELLKELAAIFKCRIELRQIGSRDKAKIVGGIGTCGAEMCCSRFLDEFDVISINMAKNQLLALNIQKLSGQCGKLMCCLKYEDEMYKEARQGLPKMNSQVTYNGERFRLTGMNVLDGSCRLSNRDNAVDITIEQLKELLQQKEETPEQKPVVKQEVKPAPKQEQKPVQKPEQKPMQKPEQRPEQNNRNKQRTNDRHKGNHHEKSKELPKQ